MNKRKRVNKKYSADFKKNVILDMRENHLNYYETVRKYWDIDNSGDEQNHTSQIRKWERIYLEEGADGFMVERRGRNSKGRPKEELDEQVKEDLIAENQRLRMENEYLKKLDALVRKEEREKGKRQK